MATHEKAPAKAPAKAPKTTPAKTPPTAKSTPESDRKNKAGKSKAPNVDGNSVENLSKQFENLTPAGEPSSSAPQARKATNTPERLLQEAIYQIQLKYAELGMPKHSETVWEGVLIDRMHEIGILAEGQQKIQQHFGDKYTLPPAKFADVLLEKKALVELKMCESFPNDKDFNQLKGYMEALGVTHGAVVCISQQAKYTILVKKRILSRGKTRSQDTYPIHEVNIYEATKLTDPKAEI